MSSDKKKIKRRIFQKLTDLCRFKEVVEAWEELGHECNETNQMVDWQNFSEKWAHKIYKWKFFEKEFLASQMQFVNTSQ